MDGEAVLRKLAANQLMGLERRPRQVDEFKATHAYLSGAVAALHEIGALDFRDGHALMDALLSPVSNPLVASGQLERVEVSVSHEAPVGSAVFAPNRGFTQAIEELHRRGVVTDDELSSIRRRIDEMFPPTGDQS
jgi:hypothetical protein